MLKSFFCIVALFVDNTFSTCAPNCEETFIGNFICDIECNNTFCDYDGGDCLKEVFTINKFENENENENEVNKFSLNFNFNSSNSYNYNYNNDNDNDNGSCNLTSCSNLFFDDCNVLQKYTNKWCNFDNDDRIYDICCAKYNTDCCEYKAIPVFLVSLWFLIMIICSCYGLFKLLSDCCGD